MSPIPGHATELGTERYRQRFPQAAADHFRQRYGLWMSSMGLGTLTGAPTDTISQAYGRTIPAALSAGCNVIDTAPNYRLGRAQRDVGAGLADAIAQGIVTRDEVIVCTKGGYIPQDWPTNAVPDDVADSIHSMHPDFLSMQISASLDALGLESVDIFYLHNPDIRLLHETPGDFMQGLRRTFEGLEREVALGRIRFYGVASDEGFLADPGAENFLPFYKLVQIAEAVAGANHRFRFIQFPYHMGLNAGLISSNQSVRIQSGEVTQHGDMPILAAALRKGIAAITCGGLAQGILVDEVPEGLGQKWARKMRKTWGKKPSPVQAALHFNRSTPGITTTLVSTTDAAHLAENLAVVPLQPWAPDPFLDFLGISG